MNKKFLSAILLGALTLASTGSFVSCKDYDDDIKNLQTQISTLALKSDVETKLGQLQSSLASAQSAAQTAQSTAEAAKKEAAEALAAAKAADNTAEVKKLEEKIAALDAEIDAQKAELAKIKDAQDAVNAALEAVKKEVSDKMSEFEKKTQDMIAEAQKKAEETVGKVADYVTSVEFLYNTPAVALNYGYVGDATLYFGKEEQDPKETKYKADRVIEFTKNSYFSFGSKVIVRVNPANAVLTKDMVQVVNANGAALDIVEVAGVKAFKGDKNGNIQSRAIETGLWEVELKLVEKKSSVDDFNKKTMTGENPNLYAVAINNTSSAAPTRNVLSDYELTFSLNTAYEGCTVSHAQFKSVETMAGKDPMAVANTKGRVDGRTSNLAVPAKSGEKIHISFNECKAQYFYVVRDDAYAEFEQSGQSELNAWKSYSYTGLNQICKVADGTDITITIPETLKTGDEVAFRIFGVNYDGTKVVDGGTSFVVYVGNNQTETSIAGSMTATKYNTITTGWLALNGTLINGNTLPSTVSVELPNGATKTLDVEYAKDSKGEQPITAGSANKDIKYVKFSAQSMADFKAWTDNKSVTASIVSLSNKEIVENVINVTLTKTLPTVEATKKMMNYTWKDGQLVNGVYTAYLYPGGNSADVVWNALQPVGYKQMTQVITGLDGKEYISVANAALKQEGDKNYYHNALEIGSAEVYNLTVPVAADDADVKLIDNTTEHELTIGYNYGAISSESNDDYKVVVETEKIVFACPVAAPTQTFAWKQYEKSTTDADGKTVKEYVDVNVLTYNNNWAAPATGLKLASFLNATNTFDNTVFGGAFNGSNVQSHYVGIKLDSNNKQVIKLTSNGSGKEDYFTVTYNATTEDFEFKAKSNTTNPTVDVPSTLSITMVDAFGHENVIKVPFTVKRAE